MTEPEPVAYRTYQPSDTRDADHLRILSICHFIWGGLQLLFSSFFIFHIYMGIALLHGTSPFGAPLNGPPPPPFLGWFAIGMGSAMVLLGWTAGILTICSGRFMVARRHRVFSIVVACINCLCMPIGTFLGVFTLLVLLRPTVQTLYPT